MMMMQDSKTLFCRSNSHGHAKEFLRKLSNNFGTSSQKVRQPCFRAYKWSIV